MPLVLILFVKYIFHKANFGGGNREPDLECRLFYNIRHKLQSLSYNSSGGALCFVFTHM